MILTFARSAGSTNQILDQEAKTQEGQKIQINMQGWREADAAEKGVQVVPLEEGGRVQTLCLAGTARTELGAGRSEGFMSLDVFGASSLKRTYTCVSSGFVREGSRASPAN